jgi:hypothetical protein
LRTVGAARFVAELEPDAPIVADRIELAANLQRLHFFDLATGQAIQDDG